MGLKPRTPAINHAFNQAVAALDAGALQTLRRLLRNCPQLATSRDQNNNPLLVRLIDWPGHRPGAAASARALLEAGAEVDARAGASAGNALSGVICTNEPDVAAVLLEFGANVDAPCGFRPGSVFDLVDGFAQHMRDHAAMQPMVQLFARHTGRQLPTRAQVGRAAPVLPCADVSRSKQFYVSKLGFTADYETADESGALRYAIVSRGNSELHLIRQATAHPQLAYCHILADPIDDLYDECVAAGLTFERAISNQPWGLRDFVIRDPDNNRLEIGGPLRS